MTIQELDKEYVAGTYARFPLTLARGAGSLVWDENGREYIDLGTGIAVNAFGVADPAWAAAVTAQLTALPHTSNLYYSAPCAELAAELCARTGMKKVFFSNSGAEANECAIKTARKYAAEKHGAACCRIVTLVNSFHGRTLATLAATGQEVFHKDFLPLTPGFSYCPPDDIGALEAMLDDGDIAGVMMECVQGEGGVQALDPSFVQSAARLCAARDVLLICDEVQCGNGRSGALYAYMNYGITPDLVTTAKGLGGGLPIGATLFGEKTAGVLKASDHGSTFGGNPAVCAGARNILSRIDDALLTGVRERSAYIVNELTGAPGVKSVTGMGLMLGVETERPAAEVIAACMERGVLVLKAKNKVRLLPALNIPFGLLEKAVGVLKACCAAEPAERGETK